MSKDIILPNKWSEQARLKICEGIVFEFSELTNALGFMVIINKVGPGHSQAGIAKRAKGFDLPTVVTHTQLLRDKCMTLLEQLGCGAETKETNESNKAKSKADEKTE